MWIAQQTARGAEQKDSAALGLVTRGGLSPAVLRGDERRSADVIGPGGLWWCPAAEEQALVLGGCVVGRRQPGPPVALAPGEVLLACGGSYVHLRADGTIRIHGRVETDEPEEEA